jgi:hypothetical protein
LEQLYTWLLIDSERAQIFLRRMNDISGWDVPEPRFERVIAKMKEEDWEVFEPASIAEIKEVENSLGLCLPEALKQVYLFSNGLNSQIGFRIFSIQELLIEDSLIKAEHREVDWYMPADSFLFFAPEGNGDYYGFPVTSSGIGNSVMQLDHETDTRDYFAQNLFELLHYQLELDDDDE